jgi:gluconate kinase
VRGEKKKTSNPPSYQRGSKRRFCVFRAEKAYRDRLRVSEDVNFVFLRGSRARIAAQLQERRAHFFDDLEEPGPPEPVLTFELTDNVHDLVAQIKTKLRR